MLFRCAKRGYGSLSNWEPADVGSIPAASTLGLATEPQAVLSICIQARGRPQQPGLLGVALVDEFDPRVAAGPDAWLLII